MSEDNHQINGAASLLSIPPTTSEMILNGAVNIDEHPEQVMEDELKEEFGSLLSEKFTSILKLWKAKELLIADQQQEKNKMLQEEVVQLRKQLQHETDEKDTLLKKFEFVQQEVVNERVKVKELEETQVVFEEFASYFEQIGNLFEAQEEIAEQLELMEKEREAEEERRARQTEQWNSLLEKNHALMNQINQFREEMTDKYTFLDLEEADEEASV
jgi:chromosome segregation ATPase